MTTQHANEAEHRTLRRADWRFLLNTPEIGVSLCFADGLLCESVRRVSQAIADVDSPARADCDLFVAIDPDARMLSQGWARLRPGGSCYTEWTVRGDCTPPQRLLEAAGFGQVEFYQPWPSIDRPQVWFPLSAPALTTQYFSGQISASHGILRRGIRTARHLSFQLSRSGLVKARVAAIAHKAGGPRTAAESVNLDMIARHWVEWGLGQVPSQLRRVMHTGGPRSFSKVIVSVYADTDMQPRVIIKAGRVSKAATGLVREKAMLAFLRRASPAPLDGVPLALLSSRHPDVHVLCESALDGRPISRRAAITNYRQIAEAATDWLIRLASTTCEPSVVPWDAVVARFIERFRRRYGAVVDPTLLSRVTATLQHVAAPPCVCEHRDFSPWNVLVDDAGRLAVADWESSRRRGIAGPDMIYFLTYLAFYRDRLLGGRSVWTSMGAFRSAYQRAWATSTDTGRINNACFARYARSLAFDPSAAPALRMLTWLIQSASEYRHLSEDGPTAPSPMTLRKALFLNLLQLECDAMPAPATAS